MLLLRSDACGRSSFVGQNHLHCLPVCAVPGTASDGVFGAWPDYCDFSQAAVRRPDDGVLQLNCERSIDNMSFHVLGECAKDISLLVRVEHLNAFSLWFQTDLGCRAFEINECVVNYSDTGHQGDRRKRMQPCSLGSACVFSFDDVVVLGNFQPFWLEARWQFLMLLRHLAGDRQTHWIRLSREVQL